MVDKSNNITPYWTFVFLFILVIMYRGTYAFPLNSSVKNFFNNHKLIIYFIFTYVTIYIFSHALNVLGENRLNFDALYLTLLFFITILFVMFCKGNIYSIILVLIIIILIDSLKISKYTYIIPSVIIIIAFFYEFIKSKKEIYNFLVN